MKGKQNKNNFESFVHMRKYLGYIYDWTISMYTNDLRNDNKAYAVNSTY